MICSIVIPWKSADFPLFMDKKKEQNSKHQIIEV
jgi:hypothetical protein